MPYSSSYFSPQHEWKATDEYLGELFPDNLAGVLANNEQAGLPPIDVSPSQGIFLGLITKIAGAKRVLEIGTLGGYSTINFARALPSDGHVTTLEVSPAHAKVARENIDSAGLSSKVTIVIGAALDTLPSLQGPFDVVFIDADKANMPHYLDLVMPLVRQGSVIIGDNVIRGGQVANAHSSDANVAGVREFLQKLADDPRLDATALQTVGIKGYDGFSLARVV